MMAALILQEQGIICEKVKQYPVLFDKQLKGYRKKDVVINTWNAVAKEIEIARFLLLPYKNNQEDWIESEAYLELSQTSAMKLF